MLWWNGISKQAGLTISNSLTGDRANTTIRAIGVDSVAFTPAAKTKLDGDFADSYLQAIKTKKFHQGLANKNVARTYWPQHPISDVLNAVAGIRKPHEEQQRSGSRWLMIYLDLMTKC
jgi:hypothetical protein